MLFDIKVKRWRKGRSWGESGKEGPDLWAANYKIKILYTKLAKGFYIARIPC